MNAKLLRVVILVVGLCLQQVIVASADEVPAAAPESNVPAAAPESEVPAPEAALPISPLLSPASGPTLSPAASREELNEDLAAIGIPSSQIAGRVQPGQNPVQINAIINGVINSRLSESYQRSTQLAAQQTQMQAPIPFLYVEDTEPSPRARLVLAALANPSTISALSPAARSQYEAVIELWLDPALAYPAPPPPAAVAGRKMLSGARNEP